tara:strand:+ start:24827 stop:25033 length:207 start_codon:yes stop_codon:yes gene_type:complete
MTFIIFKLKSSCHICFLNSESMTQLTIPLYNYTNGAFIMIVIFGLVIVGLIAGVYLMMNNDKKKKSEE